MEFINEFKPNKRYVFDKDVYIEYAMTVDEYTGTDFAEELWINACHNKEIDVINERNATIGSYGMVPEWCREIPTIRILTENDLKEMV